MRFIRTKEKSLIIETDREPSSVETYDGEKMFYIQLPTMDEIIHLIPSPALEDLYHAVNAELQIRDRKAIEDALGR